MVGRLVEVESRVAEIVASVFHHSFKVAQPSRVGQLDCRRKLLDHPRHPHGLSFVHAYNGNIVFGRGLRRGGDAEAAYAT